MSTDNSPVKHVYDGIEEHDNRLPNWWLGILWGTIFFAFAYWMYYGVFALGPNQLEEYQHALAAVTPKDAPPSGPLDEPTLLALSGDDAKVKEGSKVFASSCAACHGAEGQGVIGPNLTDGHFLYGGKPLDIHKVIAKGAVEKGMPAWERTLGEERVKNLTAYLLTIKGKNLAGKAPQGEPEP